MAPTLAGGSTDPNPSAPPPPISAADLKSMRDPFKQVVSDKSSLLAKPDIEQIPVDQFRLVAVLTGPSKIRALLRGPDGKLFTVFQGQLIGTRNGRIRRIEEDRVVVNESVVDLLGERETVATEIPLQPEKAVISASGKGAQQAAPPNGGVPNQPMPAGRRRSMKYPQGSSGRGDRNGGKMSKKAVVSISVLAMLAGTAGRAVDPPPGEPSPSDVHAAPASQQAQITDIQFNGSTDPNRIDILSSSPVHVDKQLNEQDRQLILTVPGATLARGKGRKIDTSSFNSNVMLISPYQSEDGSVRIVIQLRKPVEADLSQEGNRTRITVPVSASDSVTTGAAAPRPAGDLGPEGETAEHARNAQPAAAAATPTKEKPKDNMDMFLKNSSDKQFTGKPISLQVRDVDVEDVFRLISEASGFNIILGSDVTGKLTMSLSEVPWDQALDVVLTTLHLGADRHGNVLRVVTLQNLALEKTLECARARPPRP